MCFIGGFSVFKTLTIIGTIGILLNAIYFLRAYQRIFLGPFNEAYNDLTDKPTIGATVSVSDSAPSTPSNGDLWFKSDEAKLKVRYEDGTSNQWVDALPSGISAATRC